MGIDSAIADQHVSFPGFRHDGEWRLPARGGPILAISQVLEGCNDRLSGRGCVE
jgi:hypothetical protein